MTPLELKVEGNKAFSEGDFALASDLYSKALTMLSKDKIKDSAELSEVYVAVLINRAACHLKSMSMNLELEKAKACVKDCSEALDFRPHSIKALYRRAQAHLHLKSAPSAIRDLSKLLHLDPKNADAINLLRQARNAADRDHVGISEPLRLLRLLINSNEAHVQTAELDSILRALISLCVDEVSHAKEFVRHEGIKAVCALIQSRGQEIANGHALIATALTLLCSVCSHSEFSAQCVSLEVSGSIDDSHIDSAKILNSLHENGQMSLQWLCRLVDPDRWGVETSQVALTGVLRILKSQPAISETASAMDTSPLVPGDSRVEELSGDADIKPAPPSELVPQPFLSLSLARVVIKSMRRALSIEHTELFSLACDALVAFWSEVGDYFTPEPAVDFRMETLENRKKRTRRLGALKYRSQRHALIALEENVLVILVQALNSNDALIRARALSCFGRLITTVPDEVSHESQRKKEPKVEEQDLRLKRYLMEFLVDFECEDKSFSSLEAIKVRGSVTAALLTAKAELGIWALKHRNGMRQVLFLISTGDIRCQEIASEIICLAASADTGQEMLAVAVDSGAVYGLLRSPHAGIRAAAASAITKLSLRAKAMQEDSPEVSSVMNAALDVLRVHKDHVHHATPANPISSTSTGATQSSLVRPIQPMNTDLDLSMRTASSLASAERAVEVVAAMAGRTHIKEELVHGSFRVASAIQLLASLELDARSTAGYGLAHIFAAITVTNAELHAKALAEKDMTVEQYEQLKELQRIKGAKDENGNEIEEKREDIDKDTDVLCRARIKRVAQAGGFVCLVRLLTFGSTQTRDCAARALRQMCVEESVRGSFIQQGGLKACSDLACAPSSAESKSVPQGSPVTASTQREAAHAIAKSLITTNPALLQGHARLGVFQPLIRLAQDVDANNLQQFEALLALTNLVSLGEAEQEKFVREKGVHCVHYLMFSDHLMVRRAACEVFCNIATQEALLRLLRDPEKLKLWIGLCEDWGNDDNPEESFLIARACSGTLAVAVRDNEVCMAFLKENGGTIVASLLESGRIELIHRSLAMAESLLDSGDKNVALHLLENGCVQGIAHAHSVLAGNPGLISLAQEVAQCLSSIINQ